MKRFGLVSWILCVGLSGVLQAAPNHDWVDVIRDDDQGMELVLRAGRLDFNEEPQNIARSLLIAVPGPAGASLQILSVRNSRTPFDSGDRRQRFESLGSDVAWLERTSAVRSRTVVPLVFRPWVQSGNEFFRVEEIRVAIRYRDVPRKLRRSLEDPLYDGLLNAETAATWQLDHAVRKATEVQGLPSQRLRISIPASGIYELDFQMLSAAGLSLAGIDPRTFRILFDDWRWIPLDASIPSSWRADYQMTESAIWVEGESDASFDPGDRIYFYALGPSEYREIRGEVSSRFGHDNHPYEDMNYAWLVWDGPTGQRMQSVSASVTGNEGVPIVDRALHRQHFEEDRTYNYVDDGWLWEEPRGTRPAFANFALDMGSDQSASGTLHLNVGVAEWFNGLYKGFDLNVNGTDYPTTVIERQDVPDAQTLSFDVTLRPSSLLQMTLFEGMANFNGQTVNITSAPVLLSFDVEWQRPLQPVAGRLRWEATPGPATQVYELSGFGTLQPLVFDVTRPEAPVRLLDPAPEGSGSATIWRLHHGNGTGVPVFYRATNRTMKPVVELRNVELLRQRLTAPEMLIVTHATLRSEAERLAQHRRSNYRRDQTLDIQVVDAQDVYANFSGGRMDPFAIRNYVKFLYGLDAVPRIRYLLLFGDGTHDPRQLGLGSAPTLIPTAHHRYADDLIRMRAGLDLDYAVEDYLVEMDEPNFRLDVQQTHPLPDLAVGRITANDLTGARQIVDKIIGYDLSTDYGSWRTRVILAADDECAPRAGCTETIHISNTQRLEPLTPIEWNLEKMYLTEFPSVLGQKPAGRSALIQTWSEGGALLNYQGHGAPRQLADEVFFLASDVPALVNGGRLPMFTAFSCTVSEFDDPELQSMCEDLVSSTEGGAVATMGATTPTFATPNARYNELIWQAMFADGAESKITVGAMHVQAKIGAPDFHRRNNETYMIIGDPSMVLLSPEARIQFDVGADSLIAGSTAHIEGTIRNPSDQTILTSFNGPVEVEVLSSADDSGFRSPENPSLFLTYDLLGEAMYRGSVEVVAGRFSFDFVVPVGARQGVKGRLQAYAHAGDIDAKGGTSSVRVLPVRDPVESQGPPTIRLFFGNNLTRVKPGTELFAEIEDENGINIQGTSLRSSVLIDFDSSNQPLDVTEQFRYQAGSATLGSLSIPIPDDLSPGPHTATLIASDNLQNTATANLAFEVVESGVTRLSNVIAFPNPFADKTHFFFEVSDPVTVTVRVFTTSGRKVWSFEKFFPEATQGFIPWNGVDASQNEIANGTYIYRLEVRSAEVGVAPIRHMGKVVIMRN